jgi:hypothetical protein
LVSGTVVSKCIHKYIKRKREAEREREREREREKERVYDKKRERD